MKNDGGISRPSARRVKIWLQVWAHRALKVDSWVVWGVREGGRGCWGSGGEEGVNSPIFMALLVLVGGFAWVVYSGGGGGCGDVLFIITHLEV